MAANPNPYGGGDGNPGAPGGTRRVIRPAGGGGGDTPPKRKCCAMVEAGRAVKRGKFRLARRYAILAVRLTVARIA